MASNPPPDTRPRTLIYDGSCGFCRRWIDRIQKRDVLGRIELIPCQSSGARKRFPQISESDCLKAMYLVFPDGRYFSGADAAPWILEALPGWRWAAFFLRIPGIMLAARPIYRFIARNRRHLDRSSKCDF